MFIGENEFELPELERRADEIYIGYANNPEFYNKCYREINRECDKLIEEALGKISREQSDIISRTHGVFEELGFIQGYIHAFRTMLMHD